MATCSRQENPWSWHPYLSFHNSARVSGTLYDGAALVSLHWLPFSIQWMSPERCGLWGPWYLFLASVSRLRVLLFLWWVGYISYYIAQSYLSITRGCGLIMFSPCVFVCVCVCHDVCPVHLTTKECCYTNNILQKYSWGCLVLQSMCVILMTSSMTSPGRKVGQIMKLT